MEIVEFVVRYLGQVIHIKPEQQHNQRMFSEGLDDHWGWCDMHPGDIALFLHLHDGNNVASSVIGYSEVVEVAIDNIVSRAGRGKRFPEVPVVEITHRPSSDNVAWRSPVTEQLVLLHDPETEESSWCHRVYDLLTMDYRFITRLPNTFLSADVLFQKRHQYATVEDFLDKLCTDYE